MTFAERLQDLMNMRSMTMYRLSKDINIHQSTIKNWLQGKGEPRAAELVKIADSLGVSIFDLIDIPQEQSLKTICHMLKNINSKLQTKEKALSGDDIMIYSEMLSDISTVLEKNLQDSDTQRERLETYANIYAMLEVAKQHTIKSITKMEDENIRKNAEMWFLLMKNLNDAGLKKLIEYAEELQYVPKYQKQKQD